MSRKTSDKALLRSTDSVPPPGYIGRENASYQSDQDLEYLNDVSNSERGIEARYKQGVNHRYKVEKRSTGTNGEGVYSICLCTASVYPHYHGETIIDGNIYDEVLILDHKELQQTANKRVHLRGQCLRICKLFAIVFLVIAGIACGLYGVSHYFIANKDGKAPMVNGDVKLLQYSTYFCERIRTERSSIARSMTVIKKKIGHTASFNYDITKELQLEAEKRFHEQNIYAIKQGLLEIIIKADEDVDVLIFDEKYRVDVWKNNKNYAGYRFKRTCCKSVTTERGVYEFRTEKDQQMFLIIHSAVKTNATFTMKFKRTFTDYEKDNAICFANARDTCSVPLSFASDDKVVIEVPKSPSIIISSNVEWTCQARVWFYVLVFGGIFLAILLLTCICYCILKCFFCDPCCCCFCCYIVPKEKDNEKIVQYHRSTSTLTRTPKGPRANDVRTIQIRNPNEPINHGYMASDISRNMAKLSHIRRTNSEVTTNSEASTDFSRRRSSSNGSDIKRGMYVDDSYEELPYDYDIASDGKIVLKLSGHEVDGCSSTREKSRRKATEKRQRTPQHNQDNSDGYLGDIETRLRRKKERFSDSEDDNESDSYGSDNAYDVVGFTMSGGSKSTAEKIDSLPLGPSGAPPNAPQKSAENLKGKSEVRKVRNLEKIDILPNGMTRVPADKILISDSNGLPPTRKRSSPITPTVVIVNPNSRKRSDGYATYEREKKRKDKPNGVYTRTISLDSGLNNIDDRKNSRIRTAADVKF